MSHRIARSWHRTLASLVLAGLTVGSGMLSAREKPAPAGSVIATDARGYLEKEQLPDSLRLVPPPP